MPDPATYPVSTICKLLDLSERRVQQLSRANVIPKTERGRYELVPAVRGYIAYLRERSLDVGVVSLDVARQRKAAAEAELSEIELAKARAAVVAIDDVAKQWESILSAVRTRMLTVPTKIAPLVAVENDQSMVKELIEDAVHSALGELASGISDGGGSEEEPTGSVKKQPDKNGSAAKANNKPVGRRRKKTKS
jgi:phage terminase Nu1 subunit (DNA packaging protein)|tara:strand:- start:3857 stop:4435 length:579 start_codon:yes stop_codon:yes gene_type:complete